MWVGCPWRVHEFFFDGVGLENSSRAGRTIPVCVRRFGEGGLGGQDKVVYVPWVEWRGCRKVDVDVVVGVEVEVEFEGRVEGTSVEFRRGGG